MNIRKVILCKQRLWRLLTFWTILFLSYLPLLLQLQSKHKKKKWQVAFHKNFPLYFSPLLSTQVAQAALSCCILWWSCAASKRHLLKNSIFPPLSHTHKNGTDRTAAYWCTSQIPIVHTDGLPETNPTLLSWGAAWDFFFCFVRERGRVTEIITQQSPCLHRNNTNYQNREYTQQGWQVLGL